jgi:inner membrane protein
MLVWCLPAELLPARRRARDNTPLAGPVLFVVDPLFTLPLLSGGLAALLLSTDESLGHRLNTIGLMLSLGYLLCAFGVSEFTNIRVKEKLARQNISFSRQIGNTPFWRHG